MKKIRSKALVLVLVTVMLLSSLTGCGKKTENTGESTVTPETQSSETTVTESQKEPVTITYVDSQTPGVQLSAGIQEDPVSLKIKEDTGVSIDWDTTANADKINAMIASGDMPDIFCTTDISQLNVLIQSGAVLEVTDLLETNGSNVKSLGEKALNFSRDNLSNGTGKLYAIPTRITMGTQDSVYFQPYVGFHIRWDYFKEIGSPVLNSYDDVANAIIQIQKNHPKTADGQNVYGISMWQDWGVWNYKSISEVVGGVKSLGGLNGVAFVNTKDYTFVDGLDPVNSPYFTDGAFYNKLYRAGIVDPDSFTQTNAQATAKFEAGQDVCQLAYWMTWGPNAELSKTGSEYLSIPMNGAHYNAAQYNPVGSKFFVISSKCKNPDRAMDLLNWMYTDTGARTMLDGVEGDTWSMTDGKAAFTEKGVTMTSDSNYILNTGAKIYNNSSAIDAFSRDSKGEQFIDLFNDSDMVAKTLTTAQKEWLANYKCDTSSDLFKQYGAYAENTAYSMVQPVLSDEYKLIDAKIASYLQSELPYLIMAESDDAFAAEKDKIINGVKAIDGYDAYMEEAKTVIATAKEAGDKYK